MKVIISGGKTAGHVSPALSIIKELNAEVYYCGNQNDIEYKMCSRYVKEFIHYDMCGINRRNPFLIFKTIKKLYRGYQQAKRDLKRIEPDIVIGMGGFICAPIIMAADKLNYKCIIHEQNVVPGLANKYLSKKVTRTFLSFEDSLKYFKAKNCVVVGNPASNRVKTYKKSSLIYPKNYKRILFIGGSLGAKIINDLAVEIIKKANDFNMYFVCITGNYDIKQTYKNAVFFNFTDELTDIMQECDLIVSRAGASTMAEVLEIPKPLIVIPSPNVTNNHQEKNALPLDNNGQLLMIKEQNVSSGLLLNEIMKIIYNDELRLEMIKKNKKHYKGDSVCLFIREMKKLL